MTTRPRELLEKLSREYIDTHYDEPGAKWRAHAESLYLAGLRAGLELAAKEANTEVEECFRLKEQQLDSASHAEFFFKQMGAVRVRERIRALAQEDPR